MHHTPPRTPRSTARAEKVERLTQLIVDGLDTSLHGDDAAHCFVIAKAADSAVMEAVESAREVAGTAKFSLKVIFASGPNETLWAAAHEGDEVRCVASSNLLDAHERMIVGTETVWTGDSLRRPADKIDAFEATEQNAPNASAWAKRCFERLWALTTPPNDAGQAHAAKIAQHGLAPKQILIRSWGPHRE